MLFDFCRILAVRGAVRSSLERALSLASVVDGLDAACYRFRSDPLEEAKCRAKQDEALNSVLNLARDVSLNTLVGADETTHPVYFIEGDQSQAAIELVLRPDPTADNVDSESRVYLATGNHTVAERYNFDPNGPFSDGSSLQAVLQREPMQMRARVVVQTFVSSILSMFTGTNAPMSFSVVETVAAFREPRQQTSLPQRIDCMGVPLAQGEVSLECPRNGEPCPDPFQLNADTDLCECPYSSAAEAGCPNTPFDPVECDCLKDGEKCPDELPVVSDEGVCTSCPDTAEQECLDQNGILKEPCRCQKCPDLHIPHPDGQPWCVCDVEAAAAMGCLHVVVGADGVERKKCSCSRDCPDTASIEGPNGPLNACICVIDRQCVADGFQFDEVKCECLNTPCPGDSVLNSKTGNCSCPADRRCIDGPTDWVNCGCRPCPNGDVPVSNEDGITTACGPGEQCSGGGCSVIDGQLVIPE